jgi:hypothetical protein
VALATVAAGYGLGSVTVLSWIGVALRLIIAITMTQGLRVPTYPLAVAWALAGIVAANATEAPAFAGVALGGVLGMLWLMLKVLRPKTLIPPARLAVPPGTKLHAVGIGPLPHCAQKGFHAYSHHQ